MDRFEKLGLGPEVKFEIEFGSCTDFRDGSRGLESPLKLPTEQMNGGIIRGNGPM